MVKPVAPGTPGTEEVGHPAGLTNADVKPPWKVAACARLPYANAAISTPLPFGG